MMQALIPHQGTVKLGIVDEPQPRADEALIAVKAFSINRGETYQLEHPRRDWHPGKDVAGVVIRPAADGTGPETGARIVGHADESGWAERAALPTARLAKLPDTIDFQTAAALPLAGLTALRLTRVAGALASRRVLLTGASGGVGHYFTELAAAQGALVTAISRRGDRLRDLGAVEVLASINDAQGPFEVAIESVGGAEMVAAWHRLDQHGLLIWLGQASGERPPLDYFDWDGAVSVTIRKFNYLDSTATEAADLATLVRLVERGHLHPEIGLVDDWSNADASIDALRSRQVRGNLVLTIDW
jgi:NADPH:quinone reductase